MRKSNPPTASPPAPAGPGATPPASAPAHPRETPGEQLDLEEDIAPNLGGEDQMQDA